MGWTSCLRLSRGSVPSWPRSVVTVSSDGLTVAGTQLGGGCGSGCDDAISLTALPDGGMVGLMSEGDAGGPWAGQLVVDRFDAGLNAVPNLGASDSGPDFAYASAFAGQLPAGAQAIGNAIALSNGELVVAGAAPVSPGRQQIFVTRLFGLRAPPAPRVSVTAGSIRASTLGVSAELRCAPYAGCRGEGVLLRAGRSLASGPYDAAGGGSATLVMGLTRAGRAALQRRRVPGATLQLSLAGGAPVSVRAAVPRLTAVPRGRRGVPGALRPLASDASGLASDARRYVAFIQGTQVRVLDTATGRAFAAVAPAGCAQLASPPNVSFPAVLLQCVSSDSQVLVNVRTRGHAALPFALSSGHLAGIGRIWLGPSTADGPSCPTGETCQQYLDWHTGSVRVIDMPETPAPYGAYLYNTPVARDLDSPSLAVLPACLPYAGSNLQGSVVASSQLFVPPYVIFGAAIPFYTPGAPAGLSLARCGRAPALALDPTAAPAAGASEPGDELGSGLVSWYSPGSATVSAYDIVHNRRLRWLAPGASGAFAEPAAIVHTGSAVIVATATHQYCFGHDLPSCVTDSWTLYEARLR